MIELTTEADVINLIGFETPLKFEFIFNRRNQIKFFQFCTSIDAMMFKSKLK